MEYYVGELDLERYSFTYQTAGTVDHSRHFYATNVLFDGGGRALAWGALVGFTGTRGWNGCVSLPRELSLGPRGELIQHPAAELRTLRGDRLDIHHDVADGAVEIGDVEEGQALEIAADLRHGTNAVFGLRIAHRHGVLDIELAPPAFRLGDFSAPLARKGAGTALALFIDRTVVEIFINGTACAARVIPLVSGPVSISLYSHGDGKTSARGSVWRLRADSLFTRWRG
ncbi:GH32 C-terminal domain-containing protein [Acerihabitans sp. KWT182]|uniref:GH32 C-terminal domain-containing protein n=1 Tax=Acerihabitans sp. KWT182 TaxID=3157919 RepID=A0AAU7QEE3_9GAMM